MPSCGFTVYLDFRWSLQSDSFCDALWWSAHWKGTLIGSGQRGAVYTVAFGCCGWSLSLHAFHDSSSSHPAFRRAIFAAACAWLDTACYVCPSLLRSGTTCACRASICLDHCSSTARRYSLADDCTVLPIDKLIRCNGYRRYTVCVVLCLLPSLVGHVL